MSETPVRGTKGTKRKSSEGASSQVTPHRPVELQSASPPHAPKKKRPSSPPIGRNSFRSSINLGGHKDKNGKTKQGNKWSRIFYEMYRTFKCSGKNTFVLEQPPHDTIRVNGRVITNYDGTPMINNHQGEVSWLRDPNKQKDGRPLIHLYNYDEDGNKVTENVSQVMCWGELTADGIQAGKKAFANSPLPAVTAETFMNPLQVSLLPPRSSTFLESTATRSNDDEDDDDALVLLNEAKVRDWYADRLRGKIATKGWDHIVEEELIVPPAWDNSAEERFTDIGVKDRISGAVIYHVELKRASKYQHALGQVISNGDKLRIHNVLKQNNTHMCSDNCLFLIIDGADEANVKAALSCMRSHGVRCLGVYDCRDDTWESHTKQNT